MVDLVCNNGFGGVNEINSSKFSKWMLCEIKVCLGLTERLWGGWERSERCEGCYRDKGK